MDSKRDGSELTDDYVVQRPCPVICYKALQSVCKMVSTARETIRIQQNLCSFQIYIFSFRFFVHRGFSP